MNDWRFVNQFQPQTLFIATVICYINAVFGLIGALAGSSLGLISIGLGIGAFGIANEKRWGYATAVTAAVLQVVVLIAVFGSDVLFGTSVLNFIFDVALVALLLHPMSREYQRIWFK